MAFRATGEFTVRRAWTCRKCGKRRLGTPIRIYLDNAVNPTTEVVERLARSPQIDFPVGWSGYGAAGVECGDHKS